MPVYVKNLANLDFDIEFCSMFYCRMFFRIDVILAIFVRENFGRAIAVNVSNYIAKFRMYLLGIVYIKYREII